MEYDESRLKVVGRQKLKAGCGNGMSLDGFILLELT
jgi:hypothetical protein